MIVGFGFRRVSPDRDGGPDPGQHLLPGPAAQPRARPGASLTRRRLPATASSPATPPPDSHGQSLVSSQLTDGAGTAWLA